MQAHRAGRQFGATSLVPSQHGATEQKEEESHSLQHEWRTWWAYQAKAYGMTHSPWVSEAGLKRALSFEGGQEVPEDDEDYALVNFLNKCKVSDGERKNPQFCAGVSSRLTIFSEYHAYIRMGSSCLGSANSGERSSLV